MNPDFRPRSTDQRPSGDNQQKSVIFGQYTFPSVTVPALVGSTIGRTIQSHTIPHDLSGESGLVPYFELSAQNRAHAALRTVYPNLPDVYYSPVVFNDFVRVGDPFDANTIYTAITDTELTIIRDMTNTSSSVITEPSMIVKYFIFQQNTGENND